MTKHFGSAIKIPVQIDWFRWGGYSAIAVRVLIEWIESFKLETGDTVRFEDVIINNPSKGVIEIKTMEGHSYEVPPGYIIIRGVEGEFYPIESDIFNKTYNIK